MEISASVRPSVYTHVTTPEQLNTFPRTYILWRFTKVCRHVRGISPTIHKSQRLNIGERGRTVTLYVHFLNYLIVLRASIFLGSGYILYIF